MGLPHASPSERLAELVQTSSACTRELLDVSSGISDWPLPAGVLNALRSQEWSQGSAVPVAAALETAIANWLRREFDLDSGRLGIVSLPTCGSKEGLAAATAWAISRTRPCGKTVVLIPEGSYYAYEGAVELAGAIPREIALAPGDSMVEKLERLPAGAFDAVALLIYSLPVNPFGRADSLEELMRLLSIAEHHGCILLCDECMLELAPETRPASILDAVRRRGEFPPFLVVSNSLSKRSFASSLRAGCLLAAEPAARSLRRARMFISPIMQHPLQAASALLWEDIARSQAIREHLRISRTLIAQSMVPSHRLSFPPCGQYAWVHVDDDVDTARQALALGVRTMPSRFLCHAGKLGAWPPALRLTMSVEHRVLQAALAKLAALATHMPSPLAHVSRTHGVMEC